MSEKNGASTIPGAQTKLCTALNKFKDVGFAIAVSKSPASLLSSMLHRFCTAGFHVEGLPHGTRRAALITLHRCGEIVSKVGSSVKIGTETSEAGAGARKGSSGSRGVSGGNAGGVGNG